MKVKILGFEWIVPSFTTLQAFSQHLAEQSGKSFDSRVIAFTRSGDYWAGVVLSDKPGKAFCKKTTEGATFRVTKQDLEDGTNIVDFNFFILHSNTGRGLYQYYHHSLSLNQFHYFFRQRFNVFRDDLLRQQLANIDPSDAATCQQVKDRFDGSLRYGTLVKPESLDSLITDMERVKSIDFECATFRAFEEDFRPAAPVAKRISHHVSFNPDLIDQTKNVVKDWVSKANFLKKAKVVGVDPSGLEVAYNLVNNPASFSEADYDNWIQTVHIDSSCLVQSVVQSTIIANLLALAATPQVAAQLSIPATP